MAKKFALTLLPLFASCLFCVAQKSVVDVVDQSSVKCPVRLSGKIELTESEVDGVERTSYLDHISATNLSNVPILAMVTFTQIGNSLGPLVGQYNQLDAFFAHDLEIAPGQTYTHEHEDNGEYSAPVSQGAIKIPPAASSQVIFVQFTDGSSCGDRSDGNVISLMDTRADLLLALKKIDAASKKGEAKFLEALAEKSKDRTRNADGILNYIRDRQKQRGSADTIDYLRRMLAVAASR